MFLQLHLVKLLMKLYQTGLTTCSRACFGFLGAPVILYAARMLCATATRNLHKMTCF
jgi:hypothetical protein